MRFFKLALAVILLLSSVDSQAARYRQHNNGYFNPQKFASLVVDTDSGNVIHKENASATRYPASLTKLMTLYLTFEALQKKQLTMETRVMASRHAASQPRTNIALRPGETVTVKTLIDSLVVVSANDSAVVLAERIGKTESGFARIMTQRAHQLGMNNTNFVNASGLHNSRQVTTATDMAKMMMALKRDFPQYFHLLSQNKFSYKGICYKPHSSLMVNYAGVKAGKTGYVTASGFNLVLNAEKSGGDVVAVVMGGKTAMSRDNYMRSLLDKSFQHLSFARKSAVNSYASN